MSLVEFMRLMRNYIDAFFTRCPQTHVVTHNPPRNLDTAMNTVFFVGALLMPLYCTVISGIMRKLRSIKFNVVNVKD